MEMNKDMSGFRYERKFFAGAVGEQRVKAALRCHPAAFHEVFPFRYVNSLYFDTERMDDFLNHVNGQPRRSKMRIRWYGDRFGRIENSLLQCKKKDGLIMSKEEYPLMSFGVERGCFETPSRSSSYVKDIPELLLSDFLSRRPTLMTRYKRFYFQSSNKRFRITLDTMIDYSPAHRFVDRCCVDKPIVERGLILELKYGLAHDDEARSIAQHLPFAVSKKSKYVQGCLFAYAY